MEKEWPESVDTEKRAFLMKVAAFSAFAMPVVHSFSIDGLKESAAYAVKRPVVSPV